MRRAALLMAMALTASAETYLGYTGRWVEVEATAYSPHDAIDSEYHATKGKDRWMTAGRVSDVRKVPYGVAAPQVGPRHLTIPLRTKVIIPLGNGYLDDLGSRDEPHERVFLVDDTGSRITQNTRSTRRLHIDLRVRREADAFAYNQSKGRHRFRVFVISGLAPAPASVPVQQPVAPKPVVESPEPVPQVVTPPEPACAWPPATLPPEEPDLHARAADLPKWVFLPWFMAVIGLLYLAARLRTPR